MSLSVDTLKIAREVSNLRLPSPCTVAEGSPGLVSVWLFISQTDDITEAQV